MRILITTDFYLPAINGVVTSVFNLSNELRKRGHEVKILTLCQSQHIALENVYYVKSFGVDKLYPEARLMKSFGKKTIQAICEWSPEIIHTQSEFSTYFIAKKIAKKLSIPMIHTYHTMYEDYAHYIKGITSFNKSIIRKLSKVLMNSMDMVVVPTVKVKEALMRYQVEKPIKVVPTGVDLKLKAPLTDEAKDRIKDQHNIPKDHFIMLYLGRLGKEKNVDELIRYIKKLNHKKLTLVLVGDGPYRQVLEKLVEKEQLSKQVIFVGKVKPTEVHMYYQIADLFSSASTSETQGLTYFEALSCGIPALCRKDQCLDNVILDHFNGFQYTSYEDFKYYVTLMTSNPVKRVFMGKNAKDYSKEFSTEAFAKSIEAIYLEIIQTNTSRRNIA